ncbi:MAG: 30S ribosomal protein S13 [bacterium]|nr:30S ribosomal protein S13 [bacterium]
MPRIAGIDIPENKKVNISLTYVYGIGRTNVDSILSIAEVDPDKRVKELSADELARLQKAVDAVRVEGDLRKEIRQNISRLKDIGSYRGIRHNRGLPVHGQRTRTNARTKRGKRVTIGALKKETMAKVDAAKKEKA